MFLPKDCKSRLLTIVNSPFMRKRRVMTRGVTEHATTAHPGENPPGHPCVLSYHTTTHWAAQSANQYKLFLDPSLRCRQHHLVRNHLNCILRYRHSDRFLSAVERFKGTDWEECDDFVAAVRARALWEGKQRDPAWIADFAAPLFSRTALSWHCRLPQDVRQDWFKLEIALIDRWPPPDDGGE